MDIRKVKTNEDVMNVVESVKDKVIFLKFSAEWCGPCKSYANSLETLPPDAWKDLIVLSADVEEAEDLSYQYGVRSIPNTVFFYNGNEVGRRAGFMTQEVIVDKIKEIKG